MQLMEIYSNTRIHNEVLHDLYFAINKIGMIKMEAETDRTRSTHGREKHKNS